MTKITFSDLQLHPEILSALKSVGYESPTDIQAQSIPLALEGDDILASAQTGTGKTAAFGLPILHLLEQARGEKQEAKVDTESSKKSKSRSRKGSVKALILSPTRELTQQIEENLVQYSKNLSYKIVSVVGGLPIKKQIDALKNEADIVVATPGRLLDLINRKAIWLRDVEFFVLDEADRMLDMGFVHDVRDIARILPNERQTFFFSATLNGEVQQLASVLLKKNRKHVDVAPDSSVADNITQKVFFVDTKYKRPLLQKLVQDETIESALIFTNTRASANVISNILSRKGFSAEAIHSDKSQKDRQKVLKAFDAGEVRFLVATDVVARGIDIDGISHVINFELPTDPDSYVHRIGRTARAGASGVAISFCDLDEVSNLKSIEALLEITLTPDKDQPFHSPFVETMKNQKQSPFGKSRRYR